MIVISSSVVLAQGYAGGGVINANNPVIGWRNLVTAGNISATSEAAGYPASNLANPSTALRWRADDGGSPPSGSEQYVTVLLDTPDNVDYLAVARHNFATAQIPVSVEGLTDDGSPEVWTELVADVILPDNGPVIFRFNPQPLYAIRLRMQAGTVAPFAAVVYTGLLLVLQRRIYVGHTPMPMGRTAKITNARSENGDFLGRIVLNEKTETSVSLANLTPAWVREQLNPFLRAAVEIPFFFAWRPGAYPYETGYAWLTNDPQPSNQLANGMMQVALEMAGVT